jgi:hypothetical protein
MIHMPKESPKVITFTANSTETKKMYKAAKEYKLRTQIELEIYTAGRKKFNLNSSY